MLVLQRKLRNGSQSNAQRDGHKVCSEVLATSTPRRLLDQADSTWNRRVDAEWDFGADREATCSIWDAKRVCAYSGDVSWSWPIVSWLNFKVFIYQTCFFSRAAGGELQAILDDETCLSEAETQFCVREVLKALDYLHRRNVAHLDIKPQNILLNSSNLEGKCNWVRVVMSRDDEKKMFNLQMDLNYATLALRAQSRARKTSARFKARRTLLRRRLSSTSRSRWRPTSGRSVC